MVAEHVLRAGPPRGGTEAGELALPALATVGGTPLVDQVVTDGNGDFPLAEAEDLGRLGSWSVDLEAGTVYFSDGLRELCGHHRRTARSPTRWTWCTPTTRS